MTLDERLIKIVPSERQLAYQELEFYSFVHFTVNTFTGMEWGNGDEPESVFNPYLFDAEQWMQALEAARMRGLILTCKHHDGFCLWQSKLTEHSVKNSPWKNGQGDIVKEVSEACRRHGIKFGVYLSPWDRNCPLYGQGKAYDDFFVGQLTELLTNYGDVFSVWFDGACGEGPNGKKQYYDWDRYYKVIRELAPNACINVCGPDVRWCGNEAGHTRRAEWSVVPARTADTEKIFEASQHVDDDEFRQRKISAWDEDLGSRKILENEKDLIWYPAEVNTSIRPGWFWHDYEDDKVKPLEYLIDVYNKSVGGNATFLLNVPPTNTGLFHENDVQRLRELGNYIKTTFNNNILSSAELTADSEMNAHGIDKARSEGYDTCYIAAEGVNHAVITAQWEKPVDIGSIVLKENIKLSQRVESFRIEAMSDGELKEVNRGTVIGHKRIIPLGKLTTDCIRIVIEDSRCEPTMAFIGVYESVK